MIYSNTCVNNEILYRAHLFTKILYPSHRFLKFFCPRTAQISKEFTESNILFAILQHGAIIRYLGV